MFRHRAVIVKQRLKPESAVTMPIGVVIAAREGAARMTPPHEHRSAEAGLVAERSARA